MTVEQYNKSVDLYADAIYRFILKNINQTDEAKDIVQDTFEKLWVRAADVSFENVKPYLFSTAYHTMIDKIRKNKRISSVDEYGSIDPLHNEQYTDLGEILNEAIKQLPEVQRSVILLRDYEGYSYQEIAHITGLSESQVKVYIYRGRLTLKKYIGSLEVLI
ncbi:MAG: RNA polymerase sigma factor [Bacteroidota bacterium]|nr:RNA polymerase sigma factor [Bacteroidota bacterium]